jgi:hypothetical protein
VPTGPSGEDAELTARLDNVASEAELGAAVRDVAA